MPESAAVTGTTQPPSAPVVPPADENDVADAPAPKPVQPRPGIRKTSSREAIAAGLRAMGALPDEAPGDDDDRPAPPAAELPAPPVDAAPPATPPEPPAPPPVSWNDVMERDHQTREKARELAERERALAPLIESQKLLQENPAAWAAKFGGQDFASRFVAYVQNDGKTPPDERVSGVEKRVDDLLKQLQERDEQAREDQHIATHMQYFGADDNASLVRGWYSAEEYNGVARGLSRQIRAQTQKELTPPEAVGKLVGELKQRLERLSKTPAGQQYLRSLLGSEPKPKPAQPPVKPATTSSGPKSLSSDLAAQGNPPPGPRLRKRSERGTVVAEVLKSLTSGE